MSVRASGLWCDLCNKPILDDPYYNITINKKDGFHSCGKCKEKHDSKATIRDLCDELEGMV